MTRFEILSSNPGFFMTLILLVPVLLVPLILATDKWPKLRNGLILAASFLVASVVLGLFSPAVANGYRPEVHWLRAFPDLDIAYRLDAIGMIYAGLVALLWPLANLYSIGYLNAHQDQRQTGFFAWFSLAIAGAFQVALSANLFTLFFGYEMITLATYPLVTHYRNEASMAAGRLYLGFLFGSSIGLFLIAIIATWYMSGSLDFAEGGGQGLLGGRISSNLTSILLLAFIFGIGKAAVMPLHRWLPAAMVAPAPVSALLHGVVVVKAGAFTLLKVVILIFGYEALSDQNAALPATLAASITIILASLLAAQSDNIKKMLAYSTVAQLSYVLLAAIILAPVSAAGATFQILSHGLAKITLFFVAGSMATKHGVYHVSQMNGMAQKMPISTASLTLAALTLIGLPPTIGFMTKWFMLQGAYAAEDWLSLLVILVGTLLTASYMLPMIHAAYLRPNPVVGTKFQMEEAPWTMVLPAAITALLCVVIFFAPGDALDLVNQVMDGQP